MGPEIGVLHVDGAKKALNRLNSHRILTCVKLRTMNVNSSTLCTKEASQEDVNTLIRWAAGEGWNPGIDDSTLFYDTDPSGFFMTYAGYRPVAGISLVKHSDEQAFLGLYLCLPEFRGTGIGLATWKEALTSVSGHAVGLDGVVEQQDNYRQSGFAYQFGNTRYSGLLLPSLIDAECANTELSSLIIRSAVPADSQSLIHYDALVGGFERRPFIDAWLNPSDSRHTFIALEDGAIVGMVGIRKCIEGCKIGPLLANSSAIAIHLLSPAAEITNGENIMLDMPDNPGSVEMAQSLNLHPVFKTARMYRGPAPAIDLGKLFGVATLELG